MSVRRCYTVLAALGLMLAAHFLTVTLPYLQQDAQVWVRKSLPDDAFYYLQCAWNAVRGSGITMDGIHPSNGFHPLWMCLLLLPALACSSKAAYLCTAMGMAAAIFYVTAILFALAVRRLLSSTSSAVLALGIYLACPFLFLHHLNLLETGLLLCAKMLCIIVLLEGQVRGDLLERRFAALFAVTTALVFLARTDSIFFLFGMGVWWLAIAFRQTAGIGTGRFRALSGPLAFFVAVNVGMVLPWFAWNLILFGDVIQISGKITPHELRVYYGTFCDFAQTGWYRFVLKSIIPRTSECLKLFTTGFALPGLAMIYGVALLIAFRRGSTVRRGPLIASFSVLLFSFFGLAIVHGAIRFLPRQWYFIDATLLLVLGMAVLAHCCLFPSGAGWVLRVFCAPVFLMIAMAWTPAYRDFFSESGGFYPLQHVPSENWYKSISQLCTEHGAIGARTDGAYCIGHTDGGRASFFAPEPVRVVNLDGKINRAAAEAIMKGSLGHFIADTGISMVFMRRQLGDVSEVMGHGFRKFFLPYQIKKNDFSAFVISDETAILRRLQLPPDGRILPWREDHWSHLLGDWRLDLGQKDKARYAVKHAGIQFSLSQRTGIHLDIEASLPFRGAPSGHDILLNGEEVGTMKYDGTDFCHTLLEVPVETMREGINELVVACKEPSSPRLCGSGTDSSITYCRIRSFMVGVK